MDGFWSSGLLDSWIFPPAWAMLSQLPRRGVFFLFYTPSLGDVVADASQGHFFVLFFRYLAPKSNIWSTKVISVPDFLKNEDIWSDFINWI